MHSDSESWTINLFGQFRLINPAGETVRLSTRKCEAVLALLVLNGPDGVVRNELSVALWPNNSLERQQGNLRQALAMIRRSVGEDALLTNRTLCKLSPSFNFKSDVQDVVRGFVPSDKLLGEHAEPIFHEFRARLNPRETRVAAPGNHFPAEAFSSVLMWEAEHNPTGALELLRSHCELSHAFPPDSLRIIMDQVLSKITSSAPLYAWAIFWKGITYLSSVNLIDCRNYLYQVLDLNRELEDPLLEIEACIALSVVEILRSDFSAARRATSRAKAIKVSDASLSFSARQAKVESMDATILLHEGNTNAALREMASSSSHMDNSLIEFIENEALRGLYLAIEGHIQEAEKIMDAGKTYLSVTNLHRLTFINDLTKATLELRKGQLDDARSSFERVRSRAINAKSRHFEVYSREGESVASWLQKDRKNAKEQFEAARNVRRRLGMTYTHWDAQRLKGLPLS